MHRPCLAALAAAMLAPAARAQAPAPPYEILPLPDQTAQTELQLEAQIEAQLGDNDSRVWLEGDVLTFAHRADGGPISLMGGLQHPMERLPGTDIWLLRVSMPDWTGAFLSYDFLGPTPAGKLEYKHWRDAAAPEPPHRTDPPPAGETIEMESDALGEKRTITVVLPPNADPSGPIPAIILADGQSAQFHAASLHTLIRDGLLSPVAVVGIHSAGYRGDRTQPFDPQQDYRAREYIEQADPGRFADHLSWVVDEVLPLVVDRFNISTDPRDLAVAGFSNGAVFAASAGLRRPDVFGNVIALSMGVPIPEESVSEVIPRVRLAAGALEPSFFRATTSSFEVLESAEADVRMQRYVAGHDPLMWQIAMAAFARDLFPPDPSPKPR